MKISDSQWIFLDTETTGLKPEEGARVIEVGLADIQGLEKPGFSIDYLINPGFPIPPEITRLTHITDADVSKKGGFDSYADVILHMINRADFIAAYNKDFDRKMLESEFSRLGMKMEDKVWLDPLTWARFFMDSDDHKLGTVAKRFEVNLENAHRANADAEAAAAIMVKFIAWGIDEAAFPDDIDALKELERGWRSQSSAKSKILSPLRQKKVDPKTGKNSRPIVTTGEPGKMAPDIYDNVNRKSRALGEEYLRKLQIEKWGRRR